MTPMEMILPAAEEECPSKTVLCIPAQNSEAWVLAALYPDERVLHTGDLECRAAPEDILAGKPKAERLIRGGKKDVAAYRQRADEFAAAWEHVKKVCSQAVRFEAEFSGALP